MRRTLSTIGREIARRWRVSEVDAAVMAIGVRGDLVDEGVDEGVVEVKGKVEEGLREVDETERDGSQ
jgi:hypothetical protein